MKDIIDKFMKMDGSIRKFYLIYIMAFGVIVLLFIVALLDWSPVEKIFMGVWCVIFFYMLIVPCIRDFPRAVKKEYKVILGKIVDKDRGKSVWRVLSICEDEKNIQINVFCKKGYDGKYAKIFYLPYTKFGFVSDKNIDLVFDEELLYISEK